MATGEGGGHESGWTNRRGRGKTCRLSDGRKKLMQTPPDGERARAISDGQVFYAFARAAARDVQEAVAGRCPRRHLRLGHGGGPVPAAQGE